MADHRSRERRGRPDGCRRRQGKPSKGDDIEAEDRDGDPVEVRRDWPGGLRKQQADGPRGPPAQGVSWTPDALTRTTVSTEGQRFRRPGTPTSRPGRLARVGPGPWRTTTPHPVQVTGQASSEASARLTPSRERVEDSDLAKALGASRPSRINWPAPTRAVPHQGPGYANVRRSRVPGHKTAGRTRSSSRSSAFQNDAAARARRPGGLVPLRVDRHEARGDAQDALRAGALRRRGDDFDPAPARRPDG